ncbi:MAG TPA: prepilin peptidase [Planctomycetota bacterium]
MAGLVVAAGLLGVGVGAFLNVCAFRVPRNCLSVFRVRFRCRRCPAPLPIWSYIPLVGRRLLGGACPSCRAPFGLRDDVLELLTGLLFALAALRITYPATEPLKMSREGVLFAVHAWFIAVLVLSSAINLEFGILPDELTVAGIVQILLLSAAFPFLQGGVSLRTDLLWVRGLLAAAAGVLVGGGCAYAMGLLGRFVYKCEAVGLGVVKFMAMIGGVLGASSAASCFVLAMGLLCLYGFALRAARGAVGYVQMGPSLSMAACLLLFFPSLPSDLLSRAIAALR